MKLLFTICLISLASVLWAQPINDNCLNAISLISTDEYCSANGEYTNEGATADPSDAQAIALCVNPDFQAGVWFTFKPKAPAVIIEINGQLPLGTIGQAKAILYTGSCTAGLDFVACSPGGSDNLEFLITDLTVGARHYLYVETELDRTGTFQLCIDDFISPPFPEADCATGVVLCSKEPFFVESLAGIGDDNNELENFPDRCLNSESQSVWYKWTCGEAGTLSFTLTPNNWEPGIEGDDLDFAVFRYPNGLEDCDNKEMIRCMASGGCSNNFNDYIDCTGPTGLSLASTDTDEFPGCFDSSCSGPGTNPGIPAQADDNFVSAINMEAGVSYSVLVNNFSRTGQGFFMEFGGTGTFGGPAPDFTPEVTGNFLECDKEVTYRDNSSSINGDIATWRWNFGEGAEPLTATGQGEHVVVYESFGNKTVTLVVESTSGCEVTKLVDIVVEPCCKDTSSLALFAEIVNNACPGEEGGTIDLKANSGAPEYNFSVRPLGSNTPVDFNPNPLIQNLPSDEYEAILEDIKGCRDTVVVVIVEPDEIFVNAGPEQEIELGYDTSIDVMISDPTADVIYTWSPTETLYCPGAIDSSIVDCPNPIALSAGTTTYTVTITDENGCTNTDQVTIRTLINRPVYGANVITPGQNGRNGVLTLGFGRQAESVIEFNIYDRWGNQIFTGSNIALDENNEMVSGWNGRSGGGNQGYVNDGVYVWSAKVKFIDQVEETFAGSFTVLR